MRVIARAYGDRPLDRVVVGAAEKVVYIAAQSVARAMAPGESGGVGFPRNCVFSFDQSLFESLSSAWERKDQSKLADLWAAATPVQIAAKELA
jgi:hypothetical protein